MVIREQTAGESLHPLDVSAARLGVPIRTLRWWIQIGRVESHKLKGRRLMSESEIQRLIAQSRQPKLSAYSENSEAQKQDQSLATAA